MDLSNLRPADGSKQSDNFRRGRGHGSGNGKTAGKGHKGQKARSGATRPGFEGGQMPLYRRIPKRGFTCRNSKTIVGINISELERFEDGATVSVETLIESGIVKNPRDGVKILGNGELTKKLTVQANAFSAKAAEKISRCVHSDHNKFKSVRWHSQYSSGKCGTWREAGKAVCRGVKRGRGVSATEISNDRADR